MGGHKTAPVDARLESVQVKGAGISVGMGEGRKRQIQEIGRQSGLPIVRNVCIRIGMLSLANSEPR